MVEPGVLVAEQRPGPSWFEDAPARRSGRPVPSVSDLAATLTQELTRNRELRAQLAEDQRSSPETPADETFVDVVDKLVRAGVTYGDACREASQMRPDLYAEHRARSML
jgi:hypothetical protein